MGREMNPGQTWEYQGLTVWEGLKPRETQRLQYFFVVSKEGKKKFTYCVWTEKKDWLKRMGLEKGTDEELLTGAVHIMREKGIGRVKEKIRQGDFANVVLKLQGEKSEEIALDSLEEKLL
jgi:hypothetical protein